MRLKKRYLSLLLYLLIANLNILARSENSESWPGTASPESMGFNVAQLEAMQQKIKATPEANIHSVLILKKGHLVFEAYFNGKDEILGDDLGQIQFTKDTLHDVRSVSKSVTSALIGIAIQDGKLPQVTTNILNLLPEYRHHLAPDKADLTLHHILTMTSGLSWFENIDYTNPGNDETRMWASPDPVIFALGRSFQSKPGERFQYNGGLPTILGYLLERAYSESGLEIARKKLFEPLGITDWEWRKLSGDTIAYAAGLRLKPRDMAKIGQLYLDNGRWQGKKILPQEWVSASFTSYIPTGWTAGYGYQWWIPEFSNGKDTIRSPAAVGNGGQHIFVVKELDLVVVTTAGLYNQSRKFSGMEIMADFVLPSLGYENMKFVRGDQ